MFDVRNCYYANTRLFIIEVGEIQSMEETTQGDPIAMAIYAIAIIPLVLMLVAEANNTTKTAASGPAERVFMWCGINPRSGF